MAKRILLVLALVATIATLAARPQPSAAQSGVANTYPPYQARYFGETGHSAVNWFLEYWKNTPNALFVLGYPISQPFIEESFTNPGQYYRVQYFERAVLEEHPENFGQQDNKYYVLGRLMGTQLAKGRSDAAFQRVPNPNDGTYDADTGHTLRNSPAPFRDFWMNNGGLSVFGKPLSEQFQEVNAADGQTYWVQYFERQRMEWHPNESNPQYRILLGLLGNEYRDSYHRSNSAFNYRSADNALPNQFVYGYNVHLYGQGTPWQDRNRVMQVSKNSGVTWMRQQVRWMDLHDRSGAIYWGELDNIVNDAQANGISLMLSIVAAPGWATSNGSHGMPTRANFPKFADFMGQMAARYKGRVQAYEIWNEQNRACENGGDCATAGGTGGVVASADYYVDLLATAYDAIKANDAYAIVVSGAPTSTETNRTDIALSDTSYMASMAANPKFRTHVDAIGVHPGGQYNSPDQMWPDNPGPGPNWRNSREFYFRRIEDIRAVLVQNGMADKQIWVTEFGWATQNNTPGYEYGNSISFQTQSDWIVRGFQKGRREYAPWVGAMFVWNLNFAVPWRYQGNELHEQASFGVLNGDWSPRPAWYGIQALNKD
ncbi:cellulase family glycosylhydrolase [Candidatus Oscillochloris fontis]|uniref:cellulase family glycosylhydrolase n=1 Tax=Candidatus Oscillochloris fontis TaxID=2496868 RepID=UPI00101E0A6A|nr:cellulase family glycosylhydrolase [Candidatus Oscillochloris fontis]